MNPPTPVAVVPHTHWDREWHTPAPALQVRLTGLLDDLLALLEREPAYAHFLLDGQTAMVDDYLAARPAARERIHALAAAGRLELGPWTVLLDELLVSGETIVRNLQHGIARATELGALLEVGYLPDTFGHVAQMPQLLARAGISHAVVWRGVPAAVERTAFWWCAPDGSRVRAEYLYGSYANGRDLPADPEALVRRTEAYLAELGACTQPGEPVLLMNGGDHAAPQPALPATIAAANAAQDRRRFEITSLAAYLRDATVADLPTWAGELRSGARANVLMGVASNRVDVRQAAAAAERALEQLAEPLSALLLPPAHYPAPLLARAWDAVVLNSAHDSVGACSVDEVVDAVKVRYAEARQAAVALARVAVDACATEIACDADAVVVVNSTRHDRSGVVEATVPASAGLALVDPAGRAVPVQVLETVSPTLVDTIAVGRKLHWVADRLERGWDGRAVGHVALTPDDATNTTTLTIVLAEPGETSRDVAPTRDELFALIAADASVRVVVKGPAAHRIAFLPSVPGFGWSTYRITQETRAAESSHPPVVATATTLDNGIVRVEVDPSDGTLTLEADGVRIAGANRYVEGGDGGDTYNYSPPAADLVVDAPMLVTVDLLEAGPVRAALAVTATYRWPAHAIGDARRCQARSAETVDTVVRTRVELRAGERFVRVHGELDHQVRDHRVRVHVPLPARVESSHAESAFTVVERALVTEGGPLEAALPTFVARRFVDCSALADDGRRVGVAIVHDGLPEYEVVDDGAAVALTLLRATGYLSRAEPHLRPNPAGPLLPVAGAQVPGPRHFDYALLPHRGGWSDAALYDAADDVLIPLQAATVAAGAGTGRAATGRSLQVDGAIVSAVHRDAEGRLVVRAFNPSPGATTLHVAVDDEAAHGDVVDLRGRPTGAFTGNIELASNEIVALRLDA